MLATLDLFRPLSCPQKSALYPVPHGIKLGNGHHYRLEEQLSAGHFGTHLDHSRYTTSVADGAHLLTCMIEGFEDFSDRLVEPQKSLEYLHLAIGQCWSS